MRVGGVFAEKLVIKQGSTQAAATMNIADVYTSEASTTPAPVPLEILPSATTTPELAVIKAVIHQDSDDEEPDESLPSATATTTAIIESETGEAATSVPASSSMAAPAPSITAAPGRPACGKKNTCYDYKTSMNEACPAVRYGG